MSKFKILLFSFLAALLPLTFAVSTAAPASAATYKWANTEVEIRSYDLRVKFCDGTYGVIPAGTKRAKDVCAFQLASRYGVYVSVIETGTNLFDVQNCGATRWYTFNSSNDTSRTALVDLQFIGSHC